MDFTLRTYRQLLMALQKAGYQFITFEAYCRGEKDGKWVILRHDVDKSPKNSLATAQIESELGIKASYFFRVVKESNQPEIISAIAEFGHEIGYHYEDLSITNGDKAAAYAHFEKWLAYFRQYYPVSTICMHGAPTSKWDGRDLWKEYDYRSCGVIGEPYFDVDFSDVFYITDTGRCWDGYKVSVRDKIPQHQDRWIAMGWTFHKTKNILKSLNDDADALPQRMMITTHPQRWTDNKVKWVKEWGIQNVKNIVKSILVAIKG